MKRDLLIFVLVGCAVCIASVLTRPELPSPPIRPPKRPTANTGTGNYESRPVNGPDGIGYQCEYVVAAEGWHFPDSGWHLPPPPRPQSDSAVNYIGLDSEVQIKSAYELKTSSEADAQTATFTGVQITGNLYAVKMPCGHVLTVGPGTTIPDHDVPCPCGNPRHFLWKVQP